MNRGNGVLSALRLVLSSKIYLMAFIAMAAAFFLAYSYLLASSSINLAQPKVALNLNFYSLIVSILIGTLLSLSVAMNAFAFKNAYASGSKLSFGAILAAIIPGSLCCTFVVPAILAALGASTPTIIGITGVLQGPFATYEAPLIAISIGLLLISIILTGRRISKCCRVGK